MIPKHAISLWQVDRDLHADLNGHRVVVPATGAGIRKLLVLLEHRTDRSKIGGRGDPTQHQISKPSYSPAMIRRMHAPMTEERNEIIAATMKKLGIV